MSVYLGLDCGGSSIRALAKDEAGNKLFSGQAGAGNLATTPWDVLEANLSRASEGCPPPDAVCGCFAGLLTSSQKERAETLLSRLFSEAHVRAHPDYAAILRTAPEADVCVIAGTGSLVCSEKNGILCKSGGRGYLLGDAASAQAFGKRVLSHFLDDPKQASPASVDTIEETFHSLDEGEILTGLYRSATPAALLAKLARAAAADFEARIPYAVEAMEEEFGMLLKILKTHLETCVRPEKSVRIALAGGLWKSSGIFKQSFVLHLSRMMSELEFNVELLRRPPVQGAADLAREFAIGN